MAVHTQLCFLLFGTCLVSFLLVLECRKLEGYAFPVFSTKECPGNQAEWNNRSSAINCTESNGYMCLPNENFTDLLEFCYIYPRILVQKDLCLYMTQRFSRVNSYNCRKFTHGCPKLSYFSSETYIHPSCMEIENGCFSAEPSCKRQPLPSENSIDDTTLAINLGVSIPACLLCILAFCVILRKNLKRRRNRRRRRRRRNRERYEEEMNYLPLSVNLMDKYEESSIEEAVFDQWEHEDSRFISTKACKEVEKLIKTGNLVIVAGHSGSGKSAIIQHIALKYKGEGWIVKRITKAEDIRNESLSLRNASKQIIFVCNDPFGKESFDEQLHISWKEHEKSLKENLKYSFGTGEAKLLMSCRNYIMSDTRVSHYLLNQSDIVDIDSEKYKLSVDEKRQILTRYTSDMNLSDNECDRIVEVEKYFPLLCKLYSSKEYNNKGIDFFTEPVTVLKEKILGFRKKDKGKYCALALLVFFNDDICVNDLLKNKDTENKFKHTLKLCGLPENTFHSAIGDNLNSLKDLLVIKVGDKYRFCHDLVMEVITHVFGTDYPDETIEYADIRLLRKRVRLWDCEELTDPFNLFLSDKYVEKLGERFLNELIGNRFMDVVLNPCMKEKRMIEVLKKIIQMNPEKLLMLFKTNKYRLKNFRSEIKQLYVSKLAFIRLEYFIAPLFALIVLSHTDFSLECLITPQQIPTNSIDSSLLPAVYCNGSMKLFHIFSKYRVKESLQNKYGDLQPIHIVSVYHNYEILEELIRFGVNINSISGTRKIFTPLLLAVGNDTQRYGDYNHKESGATRRDKTVQLLLTNEADINFSNLKRTSPLHIACKMGYNSTVKLLLDKGADINSRTKDGASPLFIACKKGNDSTVQLLLNIKAKINLPREDGASPLYIACQNGHDRTVQLLLNNGALIDLCTKYGVSPLYIACEERHYSIVQLLLNNGADINLRTKKGASPLYMACLEGNDSTVQLLLNNEAEINLCTEKGTSPLYIACLKGHDSTVQLLLNNEADINLPTEDGASPLCIACINGHDSTVQLLLNNGADINLCTKEGASPLFKACKKGNDSTVQLLLNNGADINLCTKKGASPLFIACLEGHDSTVQLLLNNEADISLPTEDGASPLYIACQNGHDSTVQLLLNNGAEINICTKDGGSPLYIACVEGNNSTVTRLLSNGADIDLCTKNGVSPLYIACKYRHDSTVQLLLKNRADINLCTKYGVSPLYIACEEGHNCMVKLLMNNGADINLRTEKGASPLFIACQNGHYSTVHLLLNNGADINLRTEKGASPLYMACLEGHDSTVQLLLNNKADINLPTEDGASPLYIACQNGHDSTVQLLLNNGANVNLCTKDGASPLYIACVEGHDSTVKRLLSNGADIKLCTNDGTSPLSIACQNGHDSTKQLLLSNGADINLCEKKMKPVLFL